MKNIFGMLFMGMLFYGMGAVGAGDEGDNQSIVSDDSGSEYEGYAYRGDPPVEPITFTHPRTELAVQGVPAQQAPAPTVVSDSDDSATEDDFASDSDDSATEYDSEAYAPKKQLSFGGASAGGGGAGPRKKGILYMRVWNDFQGFSIDKVLRSIKTSLASELRKAKNSPSYAETMSKNLARVRTEMPNSALYRVLTPEQRRRVQGFLQRAEDTVKKLKATPREQARAGAQSGGMPKRSQLSAGGASAGGGGGGVGYQPGRSLPRPSMHKRVYIPPKFYKAQSVEEARAARVYINKPVDESGETPLMRALRSPEVTLGEIQRMLYRGANVHQQDDEGMTPLMHAAENAEMTAEIIQALIDAGADVDMRTHNGETALDIALLNEVDLGSPRSNAIIATLRGAKDRKDADRRAKRR